MIQQALVALLACNFLVVITYVYKTIHRRDDCLLTELTESSKPPTQHEKQVPADNADFEAPMTPSSPLVLTEISTMGFSDQEPDTQPTARVDADLGVEKRTSLD